jgi:hypothetical protein
MSVPKRWQDIDVETMCFNCKHLNGSWESFMMHVYSTILAQYRLSFIDREEFENTKGPIKIRKSKKNKQHNGQKKKYKRTNNDQQNIHIKLKIE